MERNNDAFCMHSAKKIKLNLSQEVAENQATEASTTTNGLSVEHNEIRAILHDRYFKSLETGGVLRVIITAVEEDTSGYTTTLEQLFSGTSVDTKRLSEPIVTEVPKDPPLTRQQFEEWSKVWPTSFHEDKHISRLINGEAFSKEELKEMKGYMRQAIDAGLHGKKKGMLPVGAVIVSPKTKEILCKALDLRHQHPLQHATMVCIDLVGKRHGGGAWDLEVELPKEGCTGISRDNRKHCVNSKDQNRHVCASPDFGGPIADYCKAGFADELKAVCESSSCLNCPCEDESGGKNVSSSLLTPVDSRSDSTGPYLCTGYDLYITREPCVMCSMALLHSRIQRVFYAESCSSYGGLSSKYKIHCLDGTNHHFEVFSGLLERECYQVLR